MFYRKAVWDWFLERGAAGLPANSERNLFNINWQYVMYLQVQL